MTIGITGPAPQAPGRSAVAGLIVAAIAVVICLILLGLAGDFLVDWMWFASIGYSQVFWTTIGAKAGVFLVSFAATAAMLWTNARLALHFTRHRRIAAPFNWKPAVTAAPPDPLAFIRDRLPWRLAIAGGAALIAVLVGWAETGNWSLFLQL